MQFEYRIVVYGTTPPSSIALNELGKFGWELVTLITDQNIWKSYWKRRVFGVTAEIDTDPVSHPGSFLKAEDFMPPSFNDASTRDETGVQLVKDGLETV